VLAIDVGELYLLDDAFGNNVATRGWGGAINAYNVNTLGIGESYFVNNLAMGSNATGGGVLVQAVLRFEVWDSGFNNNVVGNDSLGGGAISILSGNAINITGCNFSDNVAQLSWTGDGGGALFVGDVFNSFVARDCEFHNNSALGESFQYRSQFLERQLCQQHSKQRSRWCSVYRDAHPAGQPGSRDRGVSQLDLSEQRQSLRRCHLQGQCGRVRALYGWSALHLQRPACDEGPVFVGRERCRILASRVLSFTNPHGSISSV